jgi:hypothetical protein
MPRPVYLRPKNRMKICSNCHETKPLSEFFKDKRNAFDGLQGHCKDCQRYAIKRWGFASRRKEPIFIDPIKPVKDLPEGPPKNKRGKYIREPIMEGSKTCSKCHQDKPIIEYQIQPENKDGRRGVCNECRNSRRKYLDSLNPRQTIERNRKNTLKQFHNMTPEEYEGLLEEQDGVCAICQNPQKWSQTDNLVVDHDHKINTNRGLLCTHCNKVLGHAHDDSNILRAAADYLDKYAANPYAIVNGSNN